MREFLAAITAAIGLTLGEYELPVAELALFCSINTSARENLFHQRRNSVEGILRQESNREQLLFQKIDLHVTSTFFSFSAQAISRCCALMTILRQLKGRTRLPRTEKAVIDRVWAILWLVELCITTP
jgi:hypothetical protein